MFHLWALCSEGEMVQKRTQDGGDDYDDDDDDNDGGGGCGGLSTTVSRSYDHTYMVDYNACL